MTYPRSTLISLESTPWYHCVCRCVRRAFLCGKDMQSGMDFDHRRGWIAERIMELSAIFSIDVAAYAVMSNHYHIVLRVDENRALTLSDREVFTRWTQLFKGPDVVRRYFSETEDLSASDQLRLDELAGLYRNRLYDVSWFMRMLNESIARKANQEEGISGRFWEGHFKSQALLDEKAILAAMAYVDLNPVRAGMAETPETSDFTSIKERLDALKAKDADACSSLPSVTPQDASPDTQQEKPRASLAPFDDLTDMAFAISFGFHEYAELVDWTGRQLKRKKQGSICRKAPPLLKRLGLDAAVFVSSMDTLLEQFGTAVGDPEVLRMHCKLRGLRCMRGAGSEVFFDAA